MNNISSFGYWVRRRRKMLDMTQADLADDVSCSVSMLRKIERDERRPSEKLAELLADRLAIAGGQRQPFLQMARGVFVPSMPTPANVDVTLPPDQFEPAEPHSVFVAREKELHNLHKRLKEVAAGGGRVLFIAGEAGSGKTTLLREFARQAQAAWPELIVTGASCDIYAAVGDPLLPFREMFRLLIADLAHLSGTSVLNAEHATRLQRVSTSVAQALLDHGPHLLDTLVSSRVLEARVAHLATSASGPPPVLARLQELRARRFLTGEPELQQARLFEEVSTTLIALAQRRPLLLMLDDLHWADLSSLSLLAHLGPRLPGNAIMIVGSFRPEDLAHDRPGDAEAVGHPLQLILDESKRRFGDTRIDLDHAGSDAGNNFIDAILDVEPNNLGDGFRRRLAEVTEGHPLFVVELLRDMKERGLIEQDQNGFWAESGEMSWLHIPARVEGVLEQRILRLPPNLRQLLTVSSIQGEIFAAEVTARVLQIDEHQLIGHLSRELDRQHRLVFGQGVRQLGSGRLSQYRFRHRLFQNYLYERLAVAERIYLHERVGHALETLYEGNDNEDELPAAQLARHFQEARRAIKAGRYLLLAGQNAGRVLAFGEAATHFEHGLALLEDATQSEDVMELRFELMLALAQAYWHDGRVGESVSSFVRSMAFARTLGKPEALARAALGYEGPRWRLNLDADRSQAFMREALAAMGQQENALRVRLLVNLSRALLASGEHRELRSTVDQALTIARRIDDPVTLCDALRIIVQIDRRPEMTETRLAAIEELIVVSETIGDKERLADGLDLLIYDQLELGWIDPVDESIARHKRIADELGQPFQLHIATVFRTMRAILRGDFAVAERLAYEAAEIGEQMGVAALDGIFGMHIFTIRREQGRLATVAPLLEQVVARNPAAVWHPGLALIYASLGREQEARATFEALAQDNFAGVARDSLWVASLAYLAEVCAFLKDAERARTLHRLLLPYDERAVVVGGATACYGAAGRYLGMLATIQGEWTKAEAHFQGALDLDARMGARPWLAHTQYHYAEMLATRRRPEDGRQAHSLIAEAAETAKRLDMPYLLQKLSRLRARIDGNHK